MTLRELTAHTKQGHSFLPGKWSPWMASSEKCPFYFLWREKQLKIDLKMELKKKENIAKEVLSFNP